MGAAAAGVRTGCPAGGSAAHGSEARDSGTVRGSGGNPLWGRLEGGASGFTLAAGEHGVGGESDEAAERGTGGEGADDAAAAGDPAARGLRERGFAGAAERVIAGLWGLPGVEGNVRGYSAVSLLLIDEAARVPQPMYLALRPMLAVGGGDLWLMSTPCGKQGFFHEVWEHGGDEWFRMSVPATECPRIAKEHLEEERRAMGSPVFEQEYMCAFVENGAALFGRHVVEAAIDDEVEPLVFAW